MGLRIKTNIISKVAQRRFEENQRQLGDSLEKLSSGLRINKSADDAAGLAVSERLRSKTMSLEAAKRNASDGVSYIQVAEGGLQEVSNIVVRMRELASQAASDTIGNRERGFLDKEFQALRQEVGRIVTSTEFNGTKVLQPASTEAPIQIFVGASNRAADAAGNAPDIDPDNDPDVLKIDLGDLQFLNESLETVVNDELSLIPGSDDGGAQDLGPTGTYELFTRIDSVINAIASYRGTLGSTNSRLSSTINNIEVSNENLNAALSRIRDVDYATETTKYAQAKILSQAGLSVMMQANQLPEMVLPLIRGT